MRMSRKTILGVGLAAAMHLLLAGLTGCVSKEELDIIKSEMNAHLRIQQEVKEKMGFDIDSYYGGKITPTMMFIDLNPDQAMFEGGARDKDLIRLTQMQFFELIVFNQGKEISIPIRRDKQKIKITVKVPDLDLQDDPSGLHWPLRKHEE